MVEKTKEENIDILRMKVKLLTTFLILIAIWQVIDLLRVNSISSNVDNCATRWTTDNMQRAIDTMQRDITDLQSDMWSKVESSYVSSQIDDVYDFVREYCSGC
jgi:hypothetical protein